MLRRERGGGSLWWFYGSWQDFRYCRDRFHHHRSNRKTRFFEARWWEKITSARHFCFLSTRNKKAQARVCHQKQSFLTARQTSKLIQIEAKAKTNWSHQLLPSFILFNLTLRVCVCVCVCIMEQIEKMFFFLWRLRHDCKRRRKQVIFSFRCLNGLPTLAVWIAFIYTLSSLGESNQFRHKFTQAHMKNRNFTNKTQLWYQRAFEKHTRDEHTENRGSISLGQPPNHTHSMKYDLKSLPPPILMSGDRWRTQFTTRFTFMLSQISAAKWL